MIEDTVEEELVEETVGKEMGVDEVEQMQQMRIGTQKEEEMKCLEMMNAMWEENKEIILKHFTARQFRIMEDATKTLNFH